MQRCEKQVREDIHYFLPSSPLPFVVEMCGISYCDGTYRQERVNSPICVLEYVAEGTGTVIVEGVAHTASAGDVYLLPMGSSHRYFSDGEHPWTKLFINAWGPVIPPLLTAYGLDGQVVFPSCPLEGLFRDLFALSGGAGPGGRVRGGPWVGRGPARRPGTPSPTCTRTSRPWRGGWRGSPRPSPASPTP